MRTGTLPGMSPGTTTKPLRLLGTGVKNVKVLSTLLLLSTIAMALEPIGTRSLTTRGCTMLMGPKSELHDFVGEERNKRVSRIVEHVNVSDVILLISQPPGIHVHHLSRSLVLFDVVSHWRRTEGWPCADDVPNALNPACHSSHPASFHNSSTNPQHAMT
jgi:hypothetical protein